MANRSRKSEAKVAQKEQTGRQVVAGALIRPLSGSAGQEILVTKPIVSFWTDVCEKFDNLGKVRDLEFDFLDFPEYVPNATRVEYCMGPDEGGVDGTIRFLGTEPARILGKDYAGVPISEIDNSITRERLKYMLKAMRLGSGPLHLLARSSGPNRDFNLAEIVALPLHQNDDVVTAFVSITFLSPWSEYEHIISQEFGHF